MKPIKDYLKDPPTMFLVVISIFFLCTIINLAISILHLFINH